MPLTSKQLTAINWFKEENNLRLKLSTPPIMYFTNKDGEEESHDIGGIVTLYKHWNTDDQKARAREKRTTDTRQANIRIV